MAFLQAPRRARFYRPPAPRHARLSCTLTKATGLNFKLRSYNELDSALVTAKADNPWVKSLIYKPEGLEYETDTEFVHRLGFFSTEFSLRREQLGALWENLKSRISVNGVIDDGLDGAEA